MRLCCRGGDRDTACERSGSDVITLSGGVWCCSSTTARGPAWRRLSRCGVVCFLLDPCRRGVTAEVSTIRFQNEKAGGRCVQVLDRLQFVAFVRGVFAAVLMSQSNQPSFVFLLSLCCVVRVDVSTQPPIVVNLLRL